MNPLTLGSRKGQDSEFNPNIIFYPCKDHVLPPGVLPVASLERIMFAASQYLFQGGRAKHRSQHSRVIGYPPLQPKPMPPLSSVVPL